MSFPVSSGLIRPLDTSYTHPWTCNPRSSIASWTVGIRFADSTCAMTLSLVKELDVDVL
jgi:hypothetical protein